VPVPLLPRPTFHLKTDKQAQMSLARLRVGQQVLPAGAIGEI
jgi:hypothetical protein